jgi:hypothetical protein
MKILPQTFTNSVFTGRNAKSYDFVQQALKTLQSDPSDAQAGEIVTNQLEAYSRAVPEQIIRLQWRPRFVIEAYTPRTETLRQLVYEPGVKTFVEVDINQTRPSFWKKIFER